jgi:hypothetical protein
MRRRGKSAAIVARQRFGSSPLLRREATMTADAKGKLSDAAVSDEALRELTAITKIAPNKETCFHKHVRAAVSEIWALHVAYNPARSNQLEEDLLFTAMFKLEKSFLTLIEAASRFVNANFMTDAPSIMSVADFINELKRLKLADKSHAHWRNWFRGQPRTGWPLKPGVYRSSFGYYSNEEDRLDTEQHLFQEFRVMSAGLRKGQELIEDIYFLQQHYRMPTRLLDWTTNALAGLYFACCGDHPDADGELFILDAYQFKIDSNSQKGVATSRRPAFRDAIRVIDEWKKKAAFPHRIIPVRPDATDRRVSLQRSCFTFHVPNHPSLTKTENPSLQTLQVKAGNKQKILRELSLLGIDHFSIFGDLEHLAEWLKEAHNLNR